NQNLKETMRAEGQNFAEASERTAQTFAQRLGALSTELETAAQDAGKRADGLAELVGGQGERMIAAADKSAERFKTHLEAHEQRLGEIASLTDKRSADLTIATQGQVQLL